MNAPLDVWVRWSMRVNGWLWTVMRGAEVIAEGSAETHREAADEANRRARQHHSPLCSGCCLCLGGTNKPDRTYPDAQDLDVFGRELRAGT